MLHFACRPSSRLDGARRADLLRDWLILVRRFIGADSLAYLSLPALMRAVGRGTIDQFCRACFDGAYPVPVPQQLEMDKMALEPMGG